jgi:hypothetical protein
MSLCEYIKGEECILLKLYTYGRFDRTTCFKLPIYNIVIVPHSDYGSDNQVHFGSRFFDLSKNMYKEKKRIKIQREN